MAYSAIDTESDDALPVKTPTPSPKASRGGLAQDTEAMAGTRKEKDFENPVPGADDAEDKVHIDMTLDQNNYESDPQDIRTNDTVVQSTNVHVPEDVRDTLGRNESQPGE